MHAHPVGTRVPDRTPQHHLPERRPPLLLRTVATLRRQHSRGLFQPPIARLAVRLHPFA